MDRHDRPRRLNLNPSPTTFLIVRIFGIGIDIVETSRIEDSIERHGGRFLDRLFTEKEKAYCASMRFSARHYAARFAAKEAISKTFGTGIGTIEWTDLEILREDHGEPYVVLHGEGRRFAEKHGITRVMISLTHSDNYAAANAIAVCEGELTDDVRPKHEGMTEPE